MTKALTIRQPWASLIAEGHKTIETRSWRTSYRGRLLIHAGAADPDGTGASPECWDAFTHGNPLPTAAIVATAQLVDCLPIERCSDTRIHVCTAGGDVLIHTPLDGRTDETETLLPGEAPYGNFTPDRWAWVLDDVRPTTERCPACWRPDPGPRAQVVCPVCCDAGRCPPIPAKGKQGLWDWTP